MLRELLPSLFADLRVQVFFTVAPGSAYQDGLAALLTEVKGVVLPWDVAAASPFSLAIAASPNGPLEDLSCPLLVMAHGPGTQKTFAVTSSEDAVGEFARRERPTVIALANDEEAAQWPPTASRRNVVVGDPTFDALSASRPLRDHYREALGVRHEQRLIVVSSTWGPDSLFAQHPLLPSRLVADLPIDEYAVALVLHPNIWSSHSSWQIHVWLQSALAGGLRLIDPQAGWRAAVAAADGAIGDHGSVTFYAATHGVPTVLATFAEHELVEDGPVRMAGDRLARLSSSALLRPQVAALVAGGQSDGHTDLAERATANAGSTLEKLRRLVYDLLQLEPEGGSVLSPAAGMPETSTAPVTALRVRTAHQANPAGPATVVVERLPAATERHGTADPAAGFLVVRDDERDPGTRQSASILWKATEVSTEPEARDWCAATLAALPGCTAAAARAADHVVYVDREAEDSFLLSDWMDPDLGVAAAGMLALRDQLRPCPEAEAAEAFEIAVGERRLSLRLTRVKSATS